VRRLGSRRVPCDSSVWSSAVLICLLRCGSLRAGAVLLTIGDRDLRGGERNASRCSLCAR